MRLSASDLRDIQLFKYYRLVRKWACKTYGLTDAELELLIMLDCIDRFTRKEFMDGEYLMSWDNTRWDRFRIVFYLTTFLFWNRTTIKYTIYKTSFKCSQLISRIYRILLGEEDVPTSERSVFYKNKTYTDKVFNKAVDDMIKDNKR